MTDAEPSAKAPQPAKSKPRKIKPPRGTRDLYAAEAARRRWLMERWREVSIRHGFEEVDGPTYEAADLYAVKSGEGILGELFQAFSGKSPEEVERVKKTGRAGYALRPEFTPTLARMYAAKANTLPKPCKWFMAGPFFRAERPQRGRLREFLQWNVDVLGLDVPAEKWFAEDAESRAEVAKAKARMDAEVIGLVVDYLEAVGLTPKDCSIQIGHRMYVEHILGMADVPEEAWPAAFTLLDKRSKMTAPAFAEQAVLIGLPSTVLDLLEELRYESGLVGGVMSGLDEQLAIQLSEVCPELGMLDEVLVSQGYAKWCKYEFSTVRGLAYYTGTVFEVIADGERAVAGGGRYDNLIELFGGPPTPAVGFAMGDVVLGLLLQDKGLMPSDDELMGLAGQHPDVFVLGNATEEAEAKVRQVVAALRRGGGGRDAHPTDASTHGSESRATNTLPGLHVRHSYKATKKVDKLLNEAKKQGARFAVIIQDGESCVVKDLHTDTPWDGSIALDDLRARLIAAL